ncbi:MAG: NYN domain-containing protein, partial [Candidatus Acidifodinimicrobium sp.]
MDDAILLIDNSNFYHSLKDSRRLPFPPSDYAKLFDKLSTQFYFNLKEIILYDAVKDISKEPAQYASQQKFHSGIKNLASKWQIKIKTRKLKYRKSNNHLLPEEKGVDVLLVVDAIKAAISKTVSTVILLSGDADFVPAIDFIKSLGIKTV